MNAKNVTDDIVNTFKNYPFETHQLFLKSYLQPSVDPLGLNSGTANITYSINPIYKKYEIKEEYYDKMYFLNALIKPEVTYFNLKEKRLEIRAIAKEGLAGLAQEVEVDGEKTSTVLNLMEASSSAFLSDVEIFKIKKNATLKHLRVINGGNIASNTYYFLEDGARVEITELASKVDYFRLKSNIIETGTGAYSEAYYGYDTGNADKIDATALIVLNARNTQGNAYQRAVMRGASRIYQKALVYNTKDGPGGRSYIEQKALLLSENSYANNIPGMQLDSNDIMAKHSAATFSLSEDQLFYIMSRGLDKDTSIQILAEGILRPIKDKINSESNND
ncbi:MAG: SufD family Fe-S cluster assembly protein [Nitrososphaerota archaeon]|nr:SufD family Fe-S cluster assembly protein [Nitrososphaerota archaeon]MDG6927210.1 SufD family Fe-S cluster assembly protein [Nitrososphaerota archaeon]MDG6929732.1 SufD family Fe-S cluster assembly protein [Nitrososphaerota archaeon]MDG6932653.1 SufD family Fe-S cluster assembly protein [Nitrososphaerota archaeon]MDG6936111.1 SufD family Fe-S cluster assembly protein [Nitrososphaerota archaeon]